MRKTLSKFDRWFKAQFGLHPNRLRDPSIIEEELYSAKIKVSVLQGELDYRNMLDVQYKAASYARNAAKKDFKF